MTRTRLKFSARQHKGNRSNEQDMISNESIPLPESLAEAGTALLQLLKQRKNLAKADAQTFLQGWSSLFFIAPGLHPDESGHDEGGWPVGWRCLGAEAFRRAEAGELSDNQLYPYQSAQAALRLAGAG